jgi:hypothetical protein
MRHGPTDAGRRRDAVRVSDDPRELLAGLPRADTLPTPHGFRAIHREDVPEESRETCDAWVVANGGTVRRMPPTRRTTGRSGHMQASTMPGGAYYMVPEAALRG